MSPAPPLRVVNRSRGTVLAAAVRTAGSFRARFTGLLGTRDLPAGQGLWIARCRCVHTFGMRYPIDVAFLGAEDVVVGVSEWLVPNRISRFCPDARGALEVPAGTLAPALTEVGDRLVFQPAGRP